MTNLEDIKGLTMWQLKEILAHNDNYKGCCEKWRLMERASGCTRTKKDSSTWCVVLKTRTGERGGESV